MPENSIEMMTAEFTRHHFLLWRCLHDGPLGKETIDEWKAGSAMPWAALRARNLPLLQKIIDVYAACAVVALDGDLVVGQLRFYPKNVWQLAGSGMLCMQQFPPDGPGEDFVCNSFPPMDQLAEKTLVVHCMMTGCPTLPEHPYQRKGIATRMVHKLIVWAGQTGWEAIEATAYEELEVLYQVTGQAGRRFWEKIGFEVAETSMEEGFLQAEGFLEAMRAEAVAKGMDLDSIMKKYTMHLDIGSS